jgi:hypothetical protein
VGDVSDVLGFLHLLKAEPDLLPPAPEKFDGTDIERRRMDQVHSCLRCGKRAQAALVALTDAGPRWLDLCWEHFDWIRRTEPSPSPGLDDDLI